MNDVGFMYIWVEYYIQSWSSFIAQITYDVMDDFEKEFPEFDWKNIPAYKHPGGKNCPCPKHEYIREQINFTKQVNEKGKEPSKVTLKFCPDHYKVYTDEVIPAMPLKYRILTKIALKLGAIKIIQLKYMESELCFYCKFGSGGHDKKTELPPMWISSI